MPGTRTLTANSIVIRYLMLEWNGNIISTMGASQIFSLVDNNLTYISGRTGRIFVSCGWDYDCGS